jgi:hypothetical protein
MRELSFLRLLCIWSIWASSALSSQAVTQSSFLFFRPATFEGREPGQDASRHLAKAFPELPVIDTRQLTPPPASQANTSFEFGSLKIGVDAQEDAIEAEPSQPADPFADLRELTISGSP